MTTHKSLVKLGREFSQHGVFALLHNAFGSGIGRCLSKTTCVPYLWYWRQTGPWGDGFILYALDILLTHWDWDKMATFSQTTFKRIFSNENVRVSIKISLKFVPQGPINNIPALVQIMAWRRPGDKPLSGPMMVRLPTHICVTRPQWVNTQIVCQDCFLDPIYSWSCLLMT